MDTLFLSAAVLAISPKQRGNSMKKYWKCQHVIPRWNTNDMVHIVYDLWQYFVQAERLNFIVGRRVVLSNFKN